MEIDLPQVLVFPHSFVLSFRHFEDSLEIRGITSDCLLNELLHSKSAVHLLKGFIGPSAEILERDNFYIRPIKK